MGKSNDKLPSRVLIVRFSALGDVAIAIPVIYSLCHRYKNTQFVMLTRPLHAKVMIAPPGNLKVMGIDVKKQYKGLGGMWKLAKELNRQYHFDAVADLHSVLRSWAIDTFMQLHGVKVARINKGRREKKALVNGSIHRQLKSSRDRYVDVFSQLEFNFEETFTGFKGVKSHILPTKQAGERWIAIAPFSQHRGKVYPMRLLEQVIQELNSRPENHIFLMGGGEQEKQALRPLVQKFSRTISLAELKHDFSDEFALLEQCDVMISMDSANMHLASLARLPVISIWGATHPYCGFMGWRQNIDNAVQLDIPCRPCSVFGQKPCRFGDYRCLTGIKPQDIVGKVNTLLHNKFQQEQFISHATKEKFFSRSSKL